MNILRNIVFALITIMLSACSENEQAGKPYEYGVLKSDPPMPPLTYEWSHPDCPFTVMFPGEPEEILNRSVNGDIFLSYTYKDQYYVINIECGLTLAAFSKGKTESINRGNLNLYFQNILENGGFNEIVNVVPSPFSNLKNFTLQQTSTYENDIGDNTHSNRVIFIHDEELVSIDIMYRASQSTPINGAEVIESLKKLN